MPGNAVEISKKTTFAQISMQTYGHIIKEDYQ